MANVPVSQLKTGETIAENVMTKYNNVLFFKGKTISERDLEVLRAFLVSSVQIVSKAGEAVEQTAEIALQTEDTAANTASPFHESYDRMIALLKRVFSAAGAAAQQPPILEIRTALEFLIQQIDQYNVLTFKPKNFQLEDYLYHNSVMVSLTSYNLAKWHGLSSKDLIPVALGGLLHDIGMAKVDSGILFKPATLNIEETEDMKRHAITGYNVLKSVPGINEGVKLGALQHHEREDGSGYPLGIKGDKIHPYSKIIAITDIFHAMKSERFHKRGASPYRVLEELQKESFGKLEPSIVQTFINKVTSLHNGMLVQLNDHRIGEIVFSDRAHPTRPWVNIDGKIVNLTTERTLYIQNVIQK